MSSLGCFCPCFGDRGTAASPEPARGDRGSHRGLRWRRSGSFLPILMRRGRRNGRDRDQERVEQDFVMNDHHSNLEHPTQEEIRSGTNATSSRHFEEIDQGRRNQRNQEHVEQQETNEIRHDADPLIQEEKGQINNTSPIDFPNEESPTFTHRTASFRDHEPVFAQHRIRISLRVQLVIFFFFFLMCYNIQQEVSVHDSVPSMEENSGLNTMVPPNSSIAVNTSSCVISPASDLSSSIENGCSSIIKYTLVLLGFVTVVGLYLIWDSIYGALMLAWCLLSGFGVRDEFRLSTWIYGVSTIWRDIEIELERLID